MNVKNLKDGKTRVEKFMGQVNIANDSHEICNTC